MIVASIFKDSDSYADRWARQVREIIKPRQAVAICGTEHDQDFIGPLLGNIPFFTKYQRPSTTGHRFFDLAYAWNEALTSALAHAEKGEFILLLESEIIFDDFNYNYLLDMIGLPVPLNRFFIAPMVMCVHDNTSGQTNRRAVFYDTHGFKRGDQNFRNDLPYWDYLHGTDGMMESPQVVEIHTAGSAILAPKEAFMPTVPDHTEVFNWDTGHFDPRDCIMKFPHDVRGFCVRGSKFWHPALTTRPEGHRDPWPDGAPRIGANL